ncbi:hypothetical protein AB0G00_36965 [Nocardia salmonicida]|uniref:hypothetical protein n=1 Tax=Nocardia salmonicida TaxID=53431 RepID=UPI0033E733DB
MSVPTGWARFQVVFDVPLPKGYGEVTSLIQFYYPARCRRGSAKRSTSTAPETSWSCGSRVSSTPIARRRPAFTRITRPSRLRRACDLFGQKDGSADEAADFARTANWFANARTELAS